MTFYFPIETQVESRATRATLGGSLRERLAAARQKPAAEPSTVGIPEKPEPAEKSTGYPIPTDEDEFAKDERQAIIAVDGGTSVGTSIPVSIQMDSIILGATVGVILEPDQATVDGVVYQNDELLDLLGKRLNRDELLEIHEIKRAFGGAVIPASHVEEFKPVSRW